MNDQDQDDPLQRVAEALADGAGVDWERENREHHGLGGTLRHLKVVRDIAELHRTPESMSDGASPVSQLSTQILPSGSLKLDHWGPLQVFECIGSGGYGWVYRAFDPSLKTEVALKVLRRDRADRFQMRRFVEEAQRLARVHHPNVLVVHGVAEHDGRVGLWTDLVDGRTLESLLEEQGPFSAGEAAVMGVDLCRALAAVRCVAGCSRG